MGQKENPNGDHRVAVGSIFPFTNVGFFRYPVFLTHSRFAGGDFFISGLAEGPCRHDVLLCVLCSEADPS